MGLTLSGCATLDSVGLRGQELFLQCSRANQGELGCTRPGDVNCLNRRREEFIAVEGEERRLHWLHARGCPAESVGFTATTPRPSEPPAPTSYAIRNAGIGLTATGYALSIIGGALALGRGASTPGLLLMFPLFGPVVAPVTCGSSCANAATGFFVGNIGLTMQIAGTGLIAGGWNGVLQRPAD